MSENEKNDRFDEIVDTYKQEIFNYCFRKLSQNTFLAEEVFDDIFVHLYSKMDHLILGKNIRAYLYRTADLKIKEKLRTERRYYKHHVSLEESEEISPEGQQSTTDSYSQVDVTSTNPDDFLESPYMKEFKSSLSSQDQQLYELRIEKHLSIKETSERLNLPYSTTRLHLMSIEERVKEKIHELFY